MAEPFRLIPDNLDVLEPLLSLPFTGIVTTNYDRSLHETCARFWRHAVRPLELRDATLRNGASISEPFIARIHGRAEVPESMVVDAYDYERLNDDFDYKDFLVSVLRQRPTIFLGFSFLDPAISKILKFYGENFGPHFPTLHIALIPESTDPTLKDALGAVNIHVLTYDPAENHADLWRAIRLAEGVDVTDEPISVETTSFLADLPQSRSHVPVQPLRRHQTVTELDHEYRIYLDDLPALDGAAEKHQQLPAGSHHSVRVVEPPRELKAFPYFMAWHPRMTREPAHAWFREQIGMAVRAV